MLPFSPTISNQIRFLLQTVNESNSGSIIRELCQFVDYGSECSVLLLQTCLDQMTCDAGVVQNLQLKCHIISAVLRYLLDRPNYSTVLCEALRPTVMREGFLENLSNTLKLSIAEKIGIGLALSDSENPDLRMRGQSFCISQIELLCANPDTTLADEKIQDIIMFLYHTEGLSKHVDSFTKMLSLLQLKESSLFILSPIVTNENQTANSLRHLDLFSDYSGSDFNSILEEIEKELSMADTVRELGYGCTVNTSHCNEILSHFLPLNEITISKLIGTIARTHTGLEDIQNAHSTFCSAIGSSLAVDSSIVNTWNADVLVNSIRQLAPKTNWIRVMENLDHEGFFLPDQRAFSFLMSIYRNACQDPFPLHAICGYVWENAEGQLSFIGHAVAAQPSEFTFAHSQRKMTFFDPLRHLDGNENQAWFSLDLLEVLCQLSERGHATIVRLILEHPLNHCPEVLLVGISQVNTAYNLLQYEVSSNVLPAILKEPSKSSIIYYLWHVNPNLVLREFVNLHNIDPKNILGVLDICQELKILSAVLDAAPFPFSIKLAAIASQKDYINLEKWLSDNLSTYKDLFFKDCLGFLKGICSDVVNEVPNSSIHHPSAAVLNIYQETCPTFFKVLQIFSGQLLSHQPAEEMRKLLDLFNSRSQNSVTTDSAKMEVNLDDIDAVAHSYIQQMFNGELTIDAMIQMLARFKESSEKREQSIYDCIIGYLFEEYKFFSRYPEKQLKLAAVLFGSLIKHQLVTHLPLGIALRAVLDALRKSVDSKMFMFGTKALEQFMDRLVEWPQYCNHILQISHLRGTHAELVSVIERVLARISSSQSESNGGNPSLHEQQPVSIAPSGESMEVPESSWQLMNSVSTQPGQQPSPFQLQQRNQGFLDDKLKANATSANFTKPLFSHGGQSSLLSTPADSGTGQKTPALQSSQTSSQYSATVTSVSSSPGFGRISRSITPGGVLRQSSYSTGFGAALNIETLVAAAERRETPIEAPSSEVQDKILFMINNISTANMDAKAKEFTEVLKEQYYPWFAQYMVMKRASIEPNFHDLYLKFLERVNSRSLNKEIVKATYENCKVLLRSDLIKSSSEERSLLKNLGSWLGKFTIGRNQALLAREIDPKVLIIEAYEKGLMIAVIPFTSKILEPCQHSLAYQPPNPWTMGILGLLAEIYNLPNLKMNLKFDIEVLFKNLGVDMKDVKPTSLLKDRVREVEGNPDFSNKDASAVQPQVVADIKPGIVPVLNQVEEVNNTSYPSHSNVATQYTPAHLTSSSITNDDKIGALMVPERVASGQGLAQVASSPSPFSLSQLQPLINNYDSHINVNPKLTSMGLQLQFHRIIQASLDKAIREIISPVIQRSVTIASRTTKEIVVKDFSLESDESVALPYARMMVGTLAGSLAHVTCKEPLRLAFSNHLRSVLQALNVGIEIDQIVQNITTDNLDLGCAVIEIVASTKAIELIGSEVASAFASLRKHKEAAGYYDAAAAYAQGIFARIPESLRPKPGHLSAAQQQVYKDFVKNTWQNQSNQTSNAMRAATTTIGSDSTNSALSRGYGLNSDQANNIYPTLQVGQGFSTVGQPLDMLPEESDRSSVQILSASSNQVGASDAAIPQSAEVGSIMATFPPTVTTTELHMTDAFNVTKEMGNILPPTPTSAVERLGTVLSESLLTTGDALDKYQVVAQKLESLIAKEAKDAEIQGVVSEVPDILLRCVSRDEAALAVAQKVFKSLYENASNTNHIDSHLSILVAIRDVCKLVVKELTSWVIYSDDERKFNTEITVGLVHRDLLNLAEYNVHLAKLIDGGRNKAALEFAMSLIQALLDQEQGASVSELQNLIEALTKIASRPGCPEPLLQLLERCRNSTSNIVPQAGITISKEEKARQSRDRKVISGRSITTREESGLAESALGDPVGFRDQVSELFNEWCKICSLPVVNETVYTHFVSQLQQLSLLKGDDNTDHFFRILTELAVAHCLASEQVSTTGSLSLQSNLSAQHLNFSAVDSYAKLVVIILKYGLLDQGSSKIVLLPKILSVTVRVIQKDAEEKRAFFNPRPYFRLFINWLLDLPSSDSVLDGANFQVLTSFANAFHALQPLKVPGWSFAWLELVSHRSFMPKLLMSNSPKGWPFFQRLLVDLFKFMEPYLRNAELGEPVHFLYKGTLRVLLVLLHDFPEFLCDYHFSFCDVIPPSCIQMRNVILSAFPRNMRLPDPSTPNLKIDLLAEISLAPRILSEVDGALKAKQIKADIDEYLKTRAQDSTFMAELRQRLLLPQNEAIMAGTRYNVPLINSLVLYVGMQAIQQLQSKSASQHSPHSAPMDIFLVGAAMDIFQNLILHLDTEGRYLFLNAVANQLRYPNNHTHYFSFVLLYLFVETGQDIIQEQITRVLLERLIVNRPHPWGLLITFIELIKNPRYNFWNRSFTHCAPEIEKLFESVSRSCGGPKAVDDGIVSGGISDGSH